MENQPGGWFSPLLPFVQCLRFGCRTPGDAHGIRSRGTDSPIPVLTAHQSPVPPAGELKVSPAFSKACGFSGQRPESRSAERETPLLIPALPESTKLSLKARPQTRNSPARQARSWNPFPWNGFPYPRPYCAPSPCQTAVSATLMESVPMERIPLSPSRLRPSPCQTALRATLMESVPVERIPLSLSLLRTLFPVRPHSGRGAKEKTVPKDGLFMSGHWPRSIARPAGRASIFVLVDFRKAKIKKGISCPAGHDSGRCPENPRPFEKGRRKLYFRLRAGIGANLSPSYFLGTRTSVPPIYGWSTFGMVTVPSAWR